MLYPKIQSIYKRDPNNNHKTFLLNQYSTPEIDYLAENHWEVTEKIDGTNTRVIWNHESQTVLFGGKTDNAQIPARLYQRLQELFPASKFMEYYPDTSMTIFGEGFGVKIQRGGGNYISDGVDFILFDVNIGGFWLNRNNMNDIVEKLNINIVPLIYQDVTLQEITWITQAKNTNSVFGDFLSEGFVLKPKVQMFTRQGKRVITKIKHKDFLD